QGLGQTEKLDAVRAFLKAITPDEHAKSAEIAKLNEEKNKLDQDVGQREWEITRTRHHLIEALELADAAPTDDPMSVEMFRKSAQARLAESAHLPSGDTAAEIGTARLEFEAVRAEIGKLNQRISGLDAQIPEILRHVSQIRADIPGLSYSQKEAESPVCQVCEVPIDRALAEGCGLSHKLPDLVDRI
ncbi:MAG: chromosome segregation protein SMC, partial [bacterium]